MLNSQNQCQDYARVQAMDIRRACKEIPEERRMALREEIITRQNIMGGADSKLLKIALKNLWSE